MSRRFDIQLQYAVVTMALPAPSVLIRTILRIFALFPAFIQAFALVVSVFPTFPPFEAIPPYMTFFTFEAIPPSPAFLSSC